MKRLAVVLALAVVLGVPAPVIALDHKNLDEGRPLRLEDAYSIAHGELAVEVGAAGVFARRGPNRAVLPLEIVYGALPNLHLALGTQLSTDPHAIDEQTKSGDLHLSALYNLNQETLSLPAFGIKAGLNLPTGVDSSGVDGELKGLVTKSFGDVSLHMNAGYAFLGGTERGERDGRYELVLGASYPIGVPTHTRTTLLADVFTEQSREHGEDNVVGAEVGVRYQLTPRLVLDAGVGTEFAGPADRSPFFVTVGVSFGF
ncbi:MAG: transporter [Candidatus Rokubacteria bacterium]|nr:transporter [Candidatus Rokubacteria bacterium]